MTREQHRPQPTFDEVEGPVKPGTVLYEILRRIAREVAKALQQQAPGSRKPRSEHR